MLKFNQFIQLDEFVTAVPTKFGTNRDMNNGEAENSFGDYHTFFQHGNNSYHVGLYSDGESTGRSRYSIGIGTYQKKSPKKSDPDEDDYKYFPRKTHDKTINAAHVFGKAMHIIHHTAENKGIKKLGFAPPHPRYGGGSPKHALKLKSFYDRLVTSKPFLNHMKAHGWEYKGQHPDDGEHLFNKVSEKK